MTRRRVLALVLLTLLAAGGYAFYVIWWTPLRGVPAHTGQVAKPFSLSDHTGEMVTLDGLLAKGPAVVIFYRGYW